MIDITKLYYGLNFSGDSIRFHSSATKPVIVWTMTKKCNLQCMHCYSSSSFAVQENTDQQLSKAILNKIVELNPPALLLSGGEPLLRKDFFELAETAVENGLKLTLSTNGTMIDQRTAERLSLIGFRYVGISIDGPEDIHDRFRAKKGAFKKALKGIENCKKAGLTVGLRLTISKMTQEHVPYIFSLIRSAGIDRVCFYHLHQGGRGKAQISLELDEKEKLLFMDNLISETGALLADGIKSQVLTVGNRYDGIYLYKKMKQFDNSKADRILDLLRASKKRTSGGILNIDHDGTLFRDQFSRDTPIGNILTDSINNLTERRLEGNKRFEFCTGCDWNDLCIKSSIYSSKRLEKKICYA